MLRPAPGKRPPPAADISPERMHRPEKVTVVFGDVPLFDDGIVPELAASGPDLLVLSELRNGFLRISFGVVQEPETAY